MLSTAVLEERFFGAQDFVGCLLGVSLKEMFSSLQAAPV